MPILSHWFFDWISPLIGGLLTLSFAPFNVAYWVFLALAFLMASWQVLPPGRAALRGGLFGLGLFGFGVSWVFVSIHEYGGADLIGSLLLTALFVSVWALFPALTGYLSSKMSRSLLPGQQVLMIPCLWEVCEYLRGSLCLNGFPWFQIAYTQLDSALSGYIPVLGVYGTGFVIALMSACIVWGSRRKRNWLWSGCVLVGIGFSGALLKPIQWTFPIGEEIRVSLIQGNISQDQKWAPDNKATTLSKYRRLTEAHWDSDIVIWPETSVPAYYSEVKKDFLKPLEEEAIKHKTDVVVSLPVRSEQAGKNYNTVLVLGKQSSLYKKQHLLPFGEYLPLQPFSGYLLNLANIHLGRFLPGDREQKLLVAADYPFLTSICYEDVFAEQSRYKMKEAAFLVNVTNDAWFGKTLEPYQHMQMARMRALESGRYLLRAANTGVTGVVAPNGKVIERAPLFETSVVSATMRPMAGLTPFAWLGDEGIIAAICFLLALLLTDNLLRSLLAARRQQTNIERPFLK